MNAKKASNVAGRDAEVCLELGLVCEVLKTLDRTQAGLNGLLIHDSLYASCHGQGDHGHSAHHLRHQTEYSSSDSQEKAVAMNVGKESMRVNGEQNCSISTNKSPNIL